VRLWRAAGSTPDERLEDALPFPWLRFVFLVLLLAVLALAVGRGLTATAVAVGLLSLAPAAVTVGWIYAKTRRR
jgi:hypothetical protein